MLEIKDPAELRPLVEEMSKNPGKPVTISVRIALLKMLQSRAETGTETIDDYVERWKAGDKFPPIEVVIIPLRFEMICYNGYHRIETAKRAGESQIEATVRLGSKEDAEILAAGANVDGTRPRSQADKRAAVKLLLSNPVRAAWSNNRLAALAKVSAPLVEEVRLAMEGETGVSTHSTTRQVTRGGKTYAMKVKTKTEKKTKAVPTKTETETQTTPTKGEQAVDPVQAVVALVIKAAKGFDDATRSALLEKLLNVLGPQRKAQPE